MKAGPGRPPKERSFANMLNIAIKEATEAGPIKLRAVADKLVEMAMSGDIQAIKEVADRLDGKPAQAMDIDGETLLRIERIEYVVVEHHQEAPRLTNGNGHYPTN